MITRVNVALSTHPMLPHQVDSPPLRRKRGETPHTHPSLNPGRPLSASKELERIKNKSDNRGLISADRNNKATLLLTIPRCTSKSYTNDLSSRKMTLQSAGKHPRPFRQEHRRQPAMVQRRHKDALFVSIYYCARQKKSPRSSMDSDLEAFSHNPTDGSFAAMPDQTAAKTNYPNELFLSY